MTKTRRLLSLFFALALCLTLFRPAPAAAADLYFTSLNDTVLPLTAETMPFWSGGILYVPYTVFDPSTAGGVSLGLNCQYSRTSNSVSVYYKLQKLISFDLNTGLGRNETEGVNLDARAITRSGTPYLPLSTVCREFGLEYTYTTIRQGKLVRIKSDAVVLSDARFIDAANDLINIRLKDYNQSLAPSTGTTTPTTPGTPSTGTTVTPPKEEEVSPFSVRTYLAFRVEADSDPAGILDVLDRQGVFALFCFTPEALEIHADAVRRVLGSGHALGLLANGTSLEEVRAALQEGSAILARTAYARTTVALVPREFRSAIEAEGWVCWTETMPLSPSPTVSVASFTNSTLIQLSGRTQATFLTANADESARRVLSTLLQRLDSNRFVVSLPLETRL